MVGVDFIVAISADEQQMRLVDVQKQVFQKEKGVRIRPLQVVEKQDQRMLLLRERLYKIAQNQVEAVLV